ncbi:CHAT domain-containing protein [Sphingopyxis sp. R3-92]|uniref:CHAT domain-containing protein n=1 Tax=Sphingopyxis sp. R3-92 TaxID=3158553 RepID=UPI003EE580F4
MRLMTSIAAKTAAATPSAARFRLSDRTDGPYFMGLALGTSVTDEQLAHAAGRALMCLSTSNEKQLLDNIGQLTDQLFTSSIGETGMRAQPVWSERIGARGRIVQIRCDLTMTLFGIDLHQAQQALAGGLEADASSFVEYELVKPALLDVPSAKALLAADEAFLMIVPTPRGTHSLVVTREGLEWHRSAMTETELTGHVRRLLWDVGANIDVTPEEDERWSAEGEGDFPFDRGTAFRLYEELVAPVSPALAGKRHLFTSATGSISSLPLGILVTGKPTGIDGDAAALRATSWFADKAAIVQLPSLQSLQLLRAVAGRNAPTGSSMIGFGDPLLEGNAATRGVEGRNRTARGGGTPLASNIWRASSGETQLADPAALRRLARLSGTEKELKAMEALVGPSKTRLFLAGSATESSLKAADLVTSSILFLATHGLVAGEVGDIGEPGLVFTPPVAASPADDGLLTASEVAALRIGAGWVILSACNTATGDGRAGAPGLSGLARAFFFAGSESLLASHWPVRDDVAAVLAVRLFEILRADPTLTRAEALQQVEREIRGDTRDDPYLKSWSHPSAWAPFSLIGDVGR